MTGTVVIVVCIGLVAVGVAIVVRWGGEQAPVGVFRPSPAALLRYAGVALAAGLAAGVLAAGAGGRLVMRLLALTSPEAQGSFTEANEPVGEITAGGTIGFFLFVGLPAGVLSAAIYALVRPVLPPGRAGGLVVGALLLVLAAPRVDPLRGDNIDFAIVGPPWLAVTAFTALALFHGLVVTAVAAHLSRDPPPELGPRAVTVGRVALAVVALVAAPGLVTAVADILDA